MRGCRGWWCAAVVALGCGDNTAGRPPEGRPDAAAGPDGAALPQFGLATVKVRPGGEAAPDVTVVFHDADGAVIGEQVTDAEGIAALEVGRDSMATLALGDDLYTVTALQPEDVVDLWSPPYHFGSPIVGQVRVAGRPVAGAVDYWIALGCEPLRGSTSISPSAFLSLREACLEGDGTFDVTVLAVDAERNRLAFAYRTDVTPDADGSTRVPITWESEVPSSTISYTGGRPGVLQLFGEIDSQREGFNYSHDDSTSDGSPVTVQHLAAFEDSARVRIAVVWDGYYSDLVTSIPAPLPASFALSDSDLAPALSAGTIDTSIAGRPVASWSGDTSEVDGLHIQLVFEDTSTGLSNAWFAVVPPGTNEFRFPSLGDSSLAPFGPGVDSFVHENGTWVAAMGADFADGFDDFRDHYLLGYWDSYHPDGEPFYSATHTLAGLHLPAAAR